MWFVLVLLFAVVAAHPSDRNQWDQFGSLSGGRHFPDPRPASGTPIRPRWQHKKKPEQMNPWNPDGAAEQQAQAASDGSPDPTFPGRNGKGNRGEEFDQGTWRSREWDTHGASGKSQRSGKSDRPPFKTERLPVHLPRGPADGDRKNQMDQFLGKPVVPMMDNRQFLPIFKAENVTLQNVSTYHLKEGENIFLLPKGKEQKQPLKDGVKRPQEMGYNYFPTGPQPYVKLIYNPTATQRISFEYGITQLLPSFMKVESERD